MKSIVSGSPARSKIRLTTVYMEEICQMAEKIILFFEILASTLQSHISCVIIKRRHTLWGMLLPRFRPLSVRWGWCQISRGLWGWYSTMCAPRAGLWWECRVHVSPRHTQQPTAAVSNSDGGARAPSPHTKVRVGYIKSGVSSNDKDCHRLQNRCKGDPQREGCRWADLSMTVSQ